MIRSNTRQETVDYVSKKEEPRQVSALLYCMGEPADDVLTSTKIVADDRKKYQSVMDKFDGYFKVRQNVILERARFHRRNQLAGEFDEQYITTLYELVSTYVARPLFSP